MSGQAINSIATIIKRLEAATSRLEDIAAAGAPAATTSSSRGIREDAPAASSAGPSSGGGGGDVAAAVSGGQDGGAASETDPPAVTAFDEYLAQPLQDFAGLSEQAGGLVAQQATQVLSVFRAQRDLVRLAASCAKPSGGTSSPVFATLIKPLQEPLIAATEIREKNRGERVLFNHLSAVSEGIPAAGWVAVEPKPGPFVSEMKDSAQFYTNRVIKDFKDKDKTQVEWCRAYIKILDSLKEYIMKHHTTGLSWNPRGQDAASYSQSPSAAGPSSSGSVAPAAPAPPPPPPSFASPAGAAGAPAPPPPPPAGPTAASQSGGGGGMGAVFSQLNQGEGITRSLKKVDASQMTHKNPELRNRGESAAGTESARPAPPRPGSKPAAMRPKKPAKTALEGNKWVIEHHENNSSIVVEETELSQTVNVFGCKNSVIQVKGKLNAIAMVSCQKTSIVFDSLVSSLEITSSPSFAVQVNGRVPTIVLDSCDSGQIYLTTREAATETEIVASKCSALNVSIPKQGGEEGEYVELALPEQLRFGVTSEGGLKSEVVAHSG
ncbi:unnamed protein product [Parajaminaea phylloscopi]